MADLDHLDADHMRASLPRDTGDMEDRAWSWLNGRETGAPADRDYSADEMVDAFMAGAALAKPDRDALAKAIGDSFSPNVTFDRSSDATRLACYRAADAVILVLLPHTRGGKPLMAEPKHTERMKAMARESALRHYACSCPPNECAMSDDGGPNPVDASLCGRVAAEALADV